MIFLKLLVRLCENPRTLRVLPWLVLLAALSVLSQAMPIIRALMVISP